MILRLDPPIPLEVEGKGWGWAHFLTDYGLETDLIWTVFLESGEIWCARNPTVRACKNWTAGRGETVIRLVDKNK